MKVLASLLIIAVIGVCCVQTSPRFYGSGRLADYHARRGNRFQHGLRRNRCDLSSSTLSEVKDMITTKIDHIVTKNEKLSYSGNIINEAIRNGTLDDVILQQINGTQEEYGENETDMRNADTLSIPVEEEILVDTSQLGEDSSIEFSNSNAENANDGVNDIGNSGDNGKGTIVKKESKLKHCCFFKLLKAISKVEDEVGLAAKNILDSMKPRGHRGARRRHHGRRHGQGSGHRQAVGHHHERSHRYGRRNGQEADQEGYQNINNAQVFSA